MRSNWIFTAIVFGVAGASWFSHPRVSEERQFRGRTQIESSASFNPSELLDSKTRRPDIYKHALVELQALKTKPSCNRLAAQMLMNDCEILEKLEGQGTGSLTHLEDRLLDYIHSFASSLAICDLEAARASVPASCEQFRELSLLKTAGQGSSQALQVTHEEIGQCMSALAADHTSWTSWISNRDRARLFCQASRLDVEKDQVISLYKQMTEVLQSVGDDFQLRVKQYNEELQGHEKVQQAYFQNLLIQIDRTKEMLSKMWRGTAEEVETYRKDMNGSLNEVFGRVIDVDQLIKEILQTVSEVNIEQAAMQERAASVTIDLVLNAESANQEVQSLVQVLPSILIELVKMGDSITVMRERQDATDQKLSEAYNVVSNLTDALRIANSLGDDQTKVMEQTLQMSSRVVQHLETASISASHWSSRMLAARGPFGASWIFLILFPLMAVPLGSYGLPPSLQRNLCLVAGGLGLAILLSAIGDTISRIPFTVSEANLSTIVTAPMSDDSEMQNSLEAIISQQMLDMIEES